MDGVHTRAWSKNNVVFRLNSTARRYQVKLLLKKPLYIHPLNFLLFSVSWIIRLGPKQQLAVGVSQTKAKKKKNTTRARRRFLNVHSGALKTLFVNVIFCFFFYYALSALFFARKIFTEIVYKVKVNCRTASNAQDEKSKRKRQCIG